MGAPLTLSQVPNLTPYIQYTAVLGQTLFPYPFPITQDSDLVCVINGVTQPTDSGYTLTGQGNPAGGNLTFTSGRTGGDIVTLYRNVAIQRITQIGQNSGYASVTLNAEFNNVYLILQQLQDAISFCLQLPNTNTPTPTTKLIPSVWASKYMSFDSNGNPTPAQLTSSGTITAAMLAALLWPQTSAEVSGGSTPTQLQYLFYPEADVQRYGADPTGAADSTAAFAAAAAALSASGGGNVRFKGAYLIDNNLTLPDDVHLVGYEIRGGQRISGDYTPTKFASSLIINSAKTITHGSRCGVRQCMMFSKVISPLGAYPTPFANATVAANAVAAFAGTAITAPATFADFTLERVTAGGFSYLYDGVTNVTSANRPYFRDILLDCTNGIKVANVFDIGRAENCEAWEFLTTNQSYTTNALVTRSGTAFYTGPGSTWMKWSDCFTYGYQTGHEINGVQDVRHINCGSDGPSSSQPGSGCLGFYYHGSMGNAININPQTTALADAGIRVNTTAQNNVHTVQIIGHVAHGTTSVNGFVDIEAGNYSIIGSFYSDNSSYGHIQLRSGAGKGTVTNPQFCNLGGQYAIFGDATAMSNCNVVGETYQNCSNVLSNGWGSAIAPASWTPVLTFGGGSTGITYSAQLGTWTRVGRRVRASFQIILTSKGSSTGTALVTGLPFTVSNTPGGQVGTGSCPYSLNMASLTSTISLQAAQTHTWISVYQWGATGVSTLADTNFTNTSQLYGTVEYDIDP